MKLKYKLFIFHLLLSIFSTSIGELTTDLCCEIGITNSKSSRLCVDYTALSQYSPNETCKYFYTICCNANNKHEECTRGKAFAYRQESCYDPSKLTVNALETYDDAFSVYNDFFTETKYFNNKF
jgi:hypothetical protein